MKKEYTLSDETIGQVAKLLQIAILTGTDIVDNLRMLKLCTSKSVLVPSPSYLENFNEGIDKMMQQSQESLEVLVDE
jgi:hypothetical protein